MTIDERLRLSIHTQLTELLGSEEADALIAHIMPVPWNDVATKEALEHHVTLLRGEIENQGVVLRSEIESQGIALRSEIENQGIALRSEIENQGIVLRGEIDKLRSDMGQEMADLRIEMHRGFTAQTRWLMGYVTALSAVMLAIARLVY